jgi:hypothetical protein
MNDSPTPPRPDCTVYVDISHGGDIAVERCDEAIAALLARLGPETSSADGVSSELMNEEISPVGDNPDCPTV